MLAGLSSLHAHDQNQNLLDTHLMFLLSSSISASAATPLRYKYWVVPQHGGGLSSCPPFSRESTDHHLDGVNENEVP